MKLLIIDDEKQILSFLKINLESLGFVVDIAENGESGLSLAQINAYDLIILDLSLPDISGEDICKNLRNEGQNTKILILSANSQTTNKVYLLNTGADDYLTKPFSLEELVARIKALSRRPKEISSDLLTAQDLKLDRQKQIVSKAGKEIYLTRKEFLLLEYFMSHPNTVISRGELMEHIWDSEVNLFSKTIETHILHLRNKIDKRTKPLLKTVSGRGYKFN
jgi:DNA-binding response OmpR family regulator